MNTLQQNWADRIMGFTSYNEAYGAIDGLLEELERDLEGTKLGMLSHEYFTGRVSEALFRCRQIRNQMKAQQ